MKIILLGYMASGKSTAGKELSKKTGLPFLDLDTYIEEKEGASISAIFKEKGEIYFRKQEHTYLKEVLTSKKSFILSLGGGTPCYAGNMEYILEQDQVQSIYLQASIKTLANRLSIGREARPLVANLSEEQLKEFIGKHLFERNLFYKKANSTLIIDDKTTEEVVVALEEITRYIR
ncbi:shikimate kinase [Tenacibaculum maritimum]|uniref:Shikimate kinase n=1 Tax=Tenacibaculum maritimum NCIMB 2154 TaxID=1349785 RepID=A0A2H1EB38_9FLAO|nr:shikimate kinase [Tenacibaculum maritimum]SFZ82787.1 Shikimate kinase [Tenacibaculum maritimum NCIMB 2154]